MAIYKNIVKKIPIAADKKIKQKQYLNSGAIPIIDQGHRLIAGYTDDMSKQIICDSPVIVFGDHTKCVKIVNFPFAPGADGIKIIKPKDDSIDIDYLFYATKYLAIKIRDKGYARHYQDIEKQEIEIPTVLKQKEKVSRIEELFSSLDNAIETLNKIKMQFEVYRQAVLKEAFEGRLTQYWRVINNKVNEWKVVSIKDLIKMDRNALKAGPFGSSLKKECYVSDGYKIYGQEQVIAGDETIGNYYVDENKYQELITCKVVPGDVLISLVGTVGKVLVLSENCKEGIINPRLIKVSLDKNKMLPQFFKYYFESGYLRSLYKEKAHGATMDVLNLGMIKTLPFGCCPIDEQKQVILEIESRMTLCDSIEKMVNTTLNKAEAIRQSILKEAFEGRM